MIYNLFPQPVAVYKLERDLTRQELSFIKNQETRPNESNKTSVDSRILHNKEMTKLKEFIEIKVAEYFQTVYNPKTNVDLQIIQSWTNYTEPGQFHHKHNHPNSFVSGVFYPQANIETDKIHFYRDGFQQITFDSKNWNIWNSQLWWLEVGTNFLILFPSSLTHMVETVKGNQTRISLSFNTFPNGSVGDEIGLSGLKINV